METTHSKPSELSIKPIHAGIGIVLSLGAFAFGGFWALLALPGVLPPLRRHWSVFAGLFVGVVCIRLLMGLGFDPVLDIARDRAVSGIESGLGGGFTYRRFSGSTITGEMRFDGVNIDLPELDGSISIEQLSINAGFAMMAGQSVKVTGRGFDIRVNAAEDRLENFLRGREVPGNINAEIHLANGRISVTGSPTEATVHSDALMAVVDASGWELRLSTRAATLTLAGQQFELHASGGLTLADKGHGLQVAADIAAREREIGFGTLRGALLPGGEGSIRLTIDGLELRPLWARYRKVDSYEGFVRGKVDITGELNRLNFAMDIEVESYRYYHFTAMGLDRDNAFEIPALYIEGDLELRDGREWNFKSVSLTSPEGSLATGRRLRAVGGATVLLSGQYPALRGALVAVVESGEINEPVSFSPVHRGKLADIQPNIVLVAEQFPQLELQWEIEIKTMAVTCEPLTGTLSGTLKGTFSKAAGSRAGRLRAEGELAMTDGVVKCLGLEAALEARVVFNPNAPTDKASLRGTMKGSLGKVAVHSELTGEISRPGFIFHDAGMSAEALGRLIFNYSPEPLTPARQLERREQCSRIFGPNAALKQNPFEARHGGKVFFSVR